VQQPLAQTGGERRLEQGQDREGEGLRREPLLIVPAIKSGLDFDLDSPFLTNNLILFPKQTDSILFPRPKHESSKTANRSRQMARQQKRNNTKAVFGGMDDAGSYYASLAQGLLIDPPPPAVDCPDEDEDCGAGEMELWS
jgi:hypothetical protein